jgi:hypothetical protein
MPPAFAGKGHGEFFPRTFSTEPVCSSAVRWPSQFSDSWPPHHHGSPRTTSQGRPPADAGIAHPECRLAIIVIQCRLVNIVTMALPGARPRAAYHRVPAVEAEDIYPRAASSSAISAKHFGQYQGAGCFTGFGLRFRHFAQRYLLPLTVVLGLCCLPLRGMFFMPSLTQRGYPGCDTPRTQRDAAKPTNPAEIATPTTPRSYGTTASSGYGRETARYVRTRPPGH